MRNRMLFMPMLACLSLAGAADNALTAEESAAGYDLLFNGADLGGWHGYGADTIPDVWTVGTDAPLGPRIEQAPAGPGTGGMKTLMSDKRYRNFDLKIESQTPINGKSAVTIRFEEGPSIDQFRAGPQFNVCDVNNSDCGGADVHSFGACYDLFAVVPELRTTWYRPSGFWNQLRIIAFDSDVVHYGNGRKLLEYKLGTPEFMDAFNLSAYNRNTRFYDIHFGAFGLEHHGREGTTFRNIKAKELAVHPFLQEFRATGEWPDSLPQDFVFGPAGSGIAASRKRAISGFKATQAGPGATLVQVLGEHSGFAARSLDDRALPFRKAAAGEYLVERRGRAGLAIIRYQAMGGTRFGMINLP